MGKIIDLRGLQFGSWSVLELAGKQHHPMWRCRCVCGEERLVSGANLRTGASTNCGCLRRHVVEHGHARRGRRTATYQSWKAMHTRCNNPNAKQFVDYGGRGITICERWRDYSLFLSDMGERPEGTTIDRIDNDKGYESSNCRWAAPATQRRNSRRVVEVLVGGRAMTLKDAAKEIGVSDTAIHQERRRNGGTFQEAFVRVLSRRQ